MRIRHVGAALLFALLAGGAAHAVPATCIVSGTVLDGSSNPIANARVRIRTVLPTVANSAAYVGNDLTTKTNSSGVWSLTLTQGLAATVWIDAAGIANDITVPTGSGCPAAFSDLTLYGRGTLTPATILSDHGPSMGGDLTGSSPNPSVVGLRGYPLHTGAPATGDGWVYSATDSSFHLQPVGSANLTALSGLTGTGLVARTSSGGAFAVRTITGSSNVTVTNGDGVAGNPMLALPATISPNTTGNAATATALAATPTQCGGGQFATGVAASGDANCSAINASTITSGTLPCSVLPLFSGDVDSGDCISPTELSLALAPSLRAWVRSGGDVAQSPNTDTVTIGPATTTPGKVSIQGNGTTQPTVELQAVSGQTAPLLETRNSANAVLSQILATGNISAQPSSGSALLGTSPSGAAVGVVGSSTDIGLLGSTTSASAPGVRAVNTGGGPSLSAVGSVLDFAVLTGGVQDRGAVGSPITAASTIAPTRAISHLTGGTTVTTITVPSGLTTGTVTFICDGTTPFNTGGNLGKATACIANTALSWTYDGTAWYPSY